MYIRVERFFEKKKQALWQVVPHCYAVEPKSKILKCGAGLQKIWLLPMNGQKDFFLTFRSLGQGVNNEEKLKKIVLPFARSKIILIILRGLLKM